MHGVVSLLDAAHSAQVERLWAELDTAFDVRGVYVTPYPHFSYQVAAEYDLARVDGILGEVAGATAPFVVRTAGLGVFTGAQPVLYVPVVRTAALSALHARLWAALAPAAGGVSAYYRPDAWVPHITIGFGDVMPARLAVIVGALAQRSFAWAITVDQFALIYDTGTRQELRGQYPFGLAGLPG